MFDHTGFTGSTLGSVDFSGASFVKTTFHNATLLDVAVDLSELTYLADGKYLSGTKLGSVLFVVSEENIDMEGLFKSLREGGACRDQSFMGILVISPDTTLFKKNDEERMVANLPSAFSYMIGADVSKKWRNVRKDDLAPCLR